MYDYDHAWRLVTEHTQSESLRNHMKSVGIAMRAYAQHYGADAEQWATVGILHDWDYEENPDVSVEGHPVVGVKHLRAEGWSEEVCRAILSHAEEITGVAPESQMEKTLAAVDELTGLITAVSLVRPSKNVRDVTVSSVKKKWKDKAFAAGVNRADISHATERLGVPLDDHIGRVLTAMQEEAEALGLAGISA